MSQADLAVEPLTAARWPDFVHLFEEHGPQNGWRAAIDYAAGQGADIVEAYPLRTEITRLLHYEDKHEHRGRGSA